MRNTIRSRRFYRRLLWVAIPSLAVAIPAVVLAGAAAPPPQPSGSPPPELTVPPPPSNPAAPWMIELSGVIHSAAPDGSLPSGCATMLGTRVCVPAVTVDGTTVSDVSILTDLVGLATRPTGAGGSSVPSVPTMPNRATIISRLQSSSMVQEAVAQAIQDELLYESDGGSAQSDHAAAVATAQQELSAYEQDPAAGEAAGIVPQGMSAQEYFLSAPVIEGYQRGLAIAYERHVLAASGVSVSTWVAQQLLTKQVLIDGQAPGFSIAGALTASSSGPGA